MAATALAEEESLLILRNLETHGRYCTGIAGQLVVGDIPSPGSLGEENMTETWTETAIGLENFGIFLLNELGLVIEMDCGSCRCLGNDCTFVFCETVDSYFDHPQFC